MDGDGNGELDIEELEAAMDKMGACVSACKCLHHLLCMHSWYTAHISPIESDVVLNHAVAIDLCVNITSL